MARTNRKQLERQVAILEIMTTPEPSGWHIASQLCGNGWRGYRVEDNAGNLPFGFMFLRAGQMLVMLSSAIKLLEYRGNAHRVHAAKEGN